MHLPYDPCLERIELNKADQISALFCWLLLLSAPEGAEAFLLSWWLVVTPIDGFCVCRALEKEAGGGTVTLPAIVCNKASIEMPPGSFGACSICCCPAAAE